MNTRRKFLASLIAIPAGVVAAASAYAKPASLNLDEIIDQLYALKRSRDSQMTAMWMQTTRTSEYVTTDYLDALDVAMGVPEPERRAAYIARRKERSRRNLAEAKNQRPLPLP